MAYLWGTGSLDSAEMLWSTSSSEFSDFNKLVWDEAEPAFKLHVDLTASSDGAEIHLAPGFPKRAVTPAQVVYAESILANLQQGHINTHGQQDAGVMTLACPFCQLSEQDDTSTQDARHSAIADASSKAGPQRQRRIQKKTRRVNKMGMWWKKYGYVGHAYCQRCSEPFRDHIIRQMSNSAGCNRKKPCVDCRKILGSFARPLMWT
jgi:hypothetical protein